MLSKIIGVFWISAGLLWTARPEMLKAWLGRKMTRKIRRVVLITVMFMGLSIAGGAFKAQGIIPKIAVIAGLIIMIRAIMAVTSRTSEKLFEWWAARPVMFFRVQGAVALVLGIVLVVS